ncbi:hypothetical protein TPENAI_20068 [Tenacibaculum litopenaei]|uniref:hypothetical protein n=1 Tax=Tenacibaculum litopenaei TaxID=396016 RepID=UPI003894DB69
MKVPYSKKIREVANEGALTIAVVRGQGNKRNYVASQFKGNTSAVLKKVTLANFNKTASKKQENSKKQRKTVLGLF